MCRLACKNQVSTFFSSETVLQGAVPQRRALRTEGRPTQRRGSCRVYAASIIPATSSQGLADGSRTRMRSAWSHQRPTHLSDCSKCLTHTELSHSAQGQEAMAIQEAEKEEVRAGIWKGLGAGLCT